MGLKETDAKTGHLGKLECFGGFKAWKLTVGVTLNEI